MTTLHEHPSWRLALAPGQSHGFSANPGWWTIRSTRREIEDPRVLQHRLLLALPPLRPGGAVVDLGAGTGTFVSRLAAYHPRVRYTLIDPNADALARASKKLTAAHPGLDVAFVAEPVAPDAESPLPGAPYQLATSTIALHDIVRPAGADDPAGQAARLVLTGAGRPPRLCRRDAPWLPGDRTFGGAQGGGVR